MTPFSNPAKDFLLYTSDEPYLAKLPATSRVLLEAQTNHGEKYSAIAAAFNLPIGTVKSRINRARARIIKLRAGSD